MYPKQTLKKESKPYLFREFILVVFLFFFLIGCAEKNENMEDVGHVMAPGLEVLYFDKFIRHVSQMPPSTQGRPGEPILQLNHSFGNNEVFNSGKSRGIGIRMTGFIHLDQAGVYQFKAMANDGISLSIDDQQVFADPRVHSDRFSPTGKFTATAEGHYPLLIKYFQRKGTATLKLYWQKPGAEIFEIIPAEAYSH